MIYLVASDLASDLAPWLVARSSRLPTYLIVRLRRVVVGCVVKQLIIFCIYQNTLFASSSFDIASLLGYIEGDIVVLGCWVRVVPGGGHEHLQAGYEPSRIWIDVSSFIHLIHPTSSFILNSGVCPGEVPLCNRIISGAPALVLHSYCPLNF